MLSQFILNLKKRGHKKISTFYSQSITIFALFSLASGFFSTREEVDHFLDLVRDVLVQILVCFGCNEHLGDAVGLAELAELVKTHRVRFSRRATQDGYIVLVLILKHERILAWAF